MICEDKFTGKKSLFKNNLLQIPFQYDRTYLKELNPGNFFSNNQNLVQAIPQ